MDLNSYSGSVVTIFSWLGRVLGLAIYRGYKFIISNARLRGPGAPVKILLCSYYTPPSHIWLEYVTFVYCLCRRRWRCCWWAIYPHSDHNTRRLNRTSVYNLPERWNTFQSIVWQSNVEWSDSLSSDIIMMARAYHSSVHSAILSAGASTFTQPTRAPPQRKQTFLKGFMASIKSK